MSFDLRGDVELEVPVLVNYDETVAMMDRQYLGDFITGGGWIEREGPFPESFTNISRIAARYPDEVFEVYGTVNGNRFAYSEELVKAAIYALGGEGGFDPADFTMYRPTGTRENEGNLLTVVSNYTPEAFVINRLFGDRESFLEQFGARACPDCEIQLDDPFVTCPHCYERPDSVQNNIEKLQEQHDGCMVSMAPRMADLDDVDESMVRRPGEMPNPEVEVIESPGAAN